MNRRWVPFAYGFRPFFLLAGVYAAIGMAVWLWTYTTESSPPWSLPPQLWHSHEMLFGFIGAAVAGFVLTAVPSWTGSRGFAGTPLVALVILWFAGRIVFALPDAIPLIFVSLADALFLPAVIVTIAPSLFRTRNRNMVLLLVITAFWAADLVFLRAAYAGDIATASAALRVGIDVILFLLTIIAGRIVPSFTANALRKHGMDVSLRSTKTVERGVIVAMIAYIAVDVFSAFRMLIVAVSAIAAALHFLRMTGWHSLKSRHEPIVWILHVAYLWLPIGLTLRALFLSGGFAWAAHWQHALAAGAAATMILAVMTRASLGHTGRPLVVAPAIIVAYVSLVLAVAVRVFGPALLPVSYTAIILAAGSLWVLTFLLFAIVYVPILLGPRVDGKGG
ncbi:MAG: NnrS family protein [Gammaproteobacteria bacterium]|nr:NnrS family protein [Gammaproteobacteria bacterium]